MDKYLYKIGSLLDTHAPLKGELFPNYIFLYFVLIGQEWDFTNPFTLMNFFFFQNSHFSTIYTRHICDLLFTKMNIF